MCGIFGIVTTEPRDGLGRLATTGARILASRGPDDDGVVAFGEGLRAVQPDGRATVALAHRRLAIQDLSRAGHQPMQDRTGRFWLLYNGEVYNFPELRERLRSEGAELRSHGDTEVLLELLAREGEQALHRLDGMFALALLDVRERRLLLARDRFGVKPLYRWLAPDGALLFASEIKAFTAWPTWRARLAGQPSWDFLRRGVIDHGPETLFAGVDQIPAGHLASIDLREGSPPSSPPRRWYTLRSADAPADPEEQAREWISRLSRSVERRLRADVAVGSCLSGGLDSTTIVTILGERRAADGAESPLLTFTARHPDPALDEWERARDVARRAGAESVEVWPDGGDLWRRLPELVWIQDEPFASSSIFAQRRVFEEAAGRGVRVMLDGQGADEQIAGYHVFFKVLLLELLRGGRFVELARAWGALRREHGYSRRALARKLLAAWLPAPLVDPLARLGGGGARLARLVDPDRLGARPIDPLGRLPGRRRGVTAYCREQILAASLPALLHWEDRSSMASSVEARVPFLSHELVELSLGLPTDARIRRGETKRILRRAMRGRMSEDVLERRDKIAFVTPETSWWRGPFAPAARGALDAALDAMGPLLRPRARDRLRDELDRGGPVDSVPWRLVCFGAWVRRFDVRISPSS